MVYGSTQALRNSLPNRSPSQRPRSLSLSEYQPLTFDREATALAYRNQLHPPLSSSSSSTFGRSYGTSSQSHSHGIATASAETTLPSSLTHHLRRGDNPHPQSPIRASDSSPIDIPEGSGPFFAANLAGVGAGHSLTPPQSPVHQAAQQAHRTSLNRSAGISGSSLDDRNYVGVPPGGVWPPDLPRRPSTQMTSQPAVAVAPPELPARPSALPESTYPANTTTYAEGSTARQQSGSGVHRARRPSWLSHELGDQGGDNASTLDGTGMGTISSMSTRTGTGHRAGGSESVATDGWDSDPGYPRYIGGRHGARRQLPAVPTNVPAPEPPGWEPDYKPQIPTQLTQSSVEHAYAQLSAPPPGLPPRRNQPPKLHTIPSASIVPGESGSGGPSQRPIANDHASYSGTPIGNVYPSTTNIVDPAQSPLAPPPGAPSLPIYPPAPAPAPQPKPRRPAEETVILRADSRTPIWSTHFLDPCLRNPLVHIPFSPQVATAFSGLAKDPATAAQVDGMARMAKGWFVPPDGKFSTDKGAIDLGLGVVDCGGREGEEGWGREKGRRKARVEVSSRTGGIKLDLIELDENRQVDLKVETKTGDVMILLPRAFFGSINITTPGPDPHFCSSLFSSLSPISHPYETVYTAFIVPPSLAGTAQAPHSGSRSIFGTAAGKKQRWVPEFLRPQDGPEHGALIGEWSKLTIVTQGSKGQVVLGYREEDEIEAKALGVMVGMEGQEKKRRWWR